MLSCMRAWYQGERCGEEPLALNEPKRFRTDCFLEKRSYLRADGGGGYLRNLPEKIEGEFQL